MYAIPSSSLNLTLHVHLNSSIALITSSINVFISVYTFVIAV